MVAVVGAGLPGPDDEVAEELGRRLAEAGAVVLCGGLGGVMAAACRGARAAGGRTVGILPGTDRAAANPWVEIALATGLGEARNTVIVHAADVVVAVGGEYGTLSEVAFALKVGRPVVGVGTWTLTRGDGRADTGIRRAAGAEEAVRLARQAASASSSGAAGSSGGPA